MPTGKTATRSVELRAMQEDDVEGVFNLYDTVFGKIGGQIFRSRWQWAHVDNPLPEHSPKWVLDHGGVIVGFLAAMALPYCINGERVIANTTCDYMVHPDHRFHGIKLMKEFFNASENIVTCDDMEATLKVTQWLGAKPVGNMVRYTKVLDGRFLKKRGGKFANVPSALLSLVTVGLRLRDAVKSYGKGVTVVPVSEFDERFDRLAEKLSKNAPAMIVRDSAFLRWRYGESSPCARVNVGVIYDSDNEIAGYVIFNVSATSRIENEGYIVDIQTSAQNDKKTAEALIRYAVSNLRKQCAWVIYYRQMPSSLSALAHETLQGYGFLPRGRHVFMTKMKNDKIAEISLNERNWNYSFGDSEASHILV
jgi:hypothetical protein